MLPSALTRHPDMKEKLIYKKTHPNICTKTRARTFTPWRETWLSLAKMKCLFSWGFKKKKRKKLQSMSNYGKMHQHTLAGMTTRQIQHRFGEKSSNIEKQAGETATTEFYKKLHPVLHLRGLRNFVEILLFAWQLSRSPRLRFSTLKQIESDILQRSVMLHLRSIYSL